ncbi:PDZ and LIM domain protein Zasp isoform X2 [Anopheles moucheti]|uniref:PDZ and LIM domain protein Zasp isoform X2 n=1 Tax=Anopheles moucheti TaxID=186751 RepID=UPI0022F0F65D|nr:PDZ and LIM domain protein Zasp isoform X2 [Anopheles moucheti]
MANLMTVRLQRGDGQAWGFRLQGGKDFSAPLVLQRVNGGSVADQAGLMAGDALIKVNGTEVFNMRHKEAQDVIVAAGNSFELAVSRGGATWRPSVTPTGSLPSPSPSLPGNITPVTRTSLAATPQEMKPIGSGHNTAAKPFGAVNGNDGQIKSIVNNQYNTPVGMYSDETIAETLSSQAEVLAGGVLGVNFKKNERVYSPANSEVYKMLHEQGDDPEPAQQQQQQQQQQQPQLPLSPHHLSNSGSGTNTVTRHVSAPVDRPVAPASNGLPPGQNICASCERLIVGVFVRIKDKNLHADCFKCATCGTSLKNQGYFNLNDKLYCDIHARLAALNSPPPGTNGMVPVTVTKPGHKTGVQAISAALNAHANLNGRSQSPYGNNVNQNNITPKPFGAPLPVSPLAQVQPPASFPPVAGSVPTPFSAALVGAQAPAPAPVAAPAPAPAPMVAPAPMAAPAPAMTPASVPTPQVPGQRIEEVDYATMLLDSSVSKLACMSNNADYRKQASNVVKDMLEARLRKTDASVRAKNKENLHSNGAHAPSIARTPAFPLGTTNGKADDTKAVPPYMNGSNVVSSKAVAFNGSSNGQQELTVYPVQTTVPALAADLGKVILRPKNNNGTDVNGSQAPINGRKVSSELTSHARDRRSYVERNNNLAPYDKKQTQQETAAPQEQDPVANGSALALLKDKIPICNVCDHKIVTGPFITALGRIWCPDHFICHNANCKRPLADIGFVEEKGDLYCEYCFEEFLAPLCSKCNGRVKGDCLNAIGKQFHPECFKCTYCGKQFGNSPFFLEEGDPYCEKDWNDLFTTKCFACGFPVEAGDKWVEALNNNYHSQCFNCTSCKKNLEGQSFFAKGGRPFCKNHAR